MWPVPLLHGFSSS
ncbi:hypothetical protein ECPA4_1591, partial [Escherichia coli PA4]